MPSDFILFYFPPPYPPTPITRLLLPFHWFPSLFYISYSLLRFFLFFFFEVGMRGGVHMKVPVCRCKCGSPGACVRVEIHLCKCLFVGANKYLCRCVYACVRVCARVQVHMKAREWSIVPSSEMSPPPLRQGPSVAGRSDQQLGYMAIQ